MRILAPVMIAFSMFSAVPMPQIEWDSRNMQYALCAFPLVGALIGGGCWLWSLLSDLLRFPTVVRASGFCLLPVMLTGGIHLDGYADTWDALASHGDRESMQRILKDPHIGTFAVIRLICYFLASFALWASLEQFRPLPFLLSFCLSRTLSALSLTAFPLREGSGLARSFSEAADRKTVRLFCMILSLLLSAGLLLCGGWAMLPAAVLVFWHYHRTAVKKFGGVSGDLAGWFLQKAEFWMLFCFCAVQYMEKFL